MSDVLYLAWRYLAYHRVKTAVLVAAVAIIVYLPVGLNIIVSQSAKELTTRAQATPLLVGAKGSPLELVLNSLYFESDTPPAMRYAEVDRVEHLDRDHPAVSNAVKVVERKILERAPLRYQVEELSARLDRL